MEAQFCSAWSAPIDYNLMPLLVARELIIFWPVALATESVDSNWCNMTCIIFYGIIPF
jgi:hypothetical protein